MAAGALAIAATQGQPPWQGTEPGCADQPAGAACWMELDSPPGCFVWRQGLKRGESVTWTGGCTDSRADGLGRLMWTWNATPFRVVEVAGTGRLRGGKLEGRWVERFTGGAVWEGR